MTIMSDWLARAAASYPAKLAIRCGATDWTFAELDHQVNRLAQYLATVGIGDGDRVALVAANGMPCVAVVHALIRLGAILVPLNTRLAPAELIWQTQDVRADWLINDDHGAALAASIAEAIPALPHLTLTAAFFTETDVAAPYPPTDLPLRAEIDLAITHAIIYTSGTTGQPKGAQITLGMHWWNAVGSALNLGHQPDDRWLAVLPFFHIGGLTILMRSVIYGIGVVIHERFDPATVNASIRQDGVSIISVVAVMLQRMLENLAPGARYPTTLRCVLLGGGPAPQPLLAACADRAIPVVQTYGMTESCSQAVTLAPQDALRKLGSAGKPLLPVQLRIMHDGHEANHDEAGEIELRGPTITPGYADRPDSTDRAWQSGWFATGDIGRCDAEGYLYILDRRSDLIISGGENVYPAEIEAVLLGHPAVAEAGVCGMPDAQWGQVPVAFVHLHEGSDVTSPEILAYATAHLARYKMPRAVFLTGPLPRNAAGKLLRRELLRLLPE